MERSRDMTECLSPDGIGCAHLEPDDAVIAGALGTWVLTITVGSRGVAADGRIRVFTDTDTDWGTPQFLDPVGQDYATVEGPEDVSLSAVAHGGSSLTLGVSKRPLRPGERVRVVLGDRSGGGPGSRAQTFLESRRFFRVAIDSDASGNCEDLPSPPWVEVVGGPADRLVVLAPSTVAAGEPFRLMVKAEDAWGNPSAEYAGSVAIASDGVGLPEDSLAFTSANRGVRWIEGCTAFGPGLAHIQVEDPETGLI
ncbi:MAG: hypothetical protein QGI83_18525, partial [Candidatus Latescibacteria bacterium]|nr:hypothetical protein [Candidatus Latescibacterota bacterium]